MMKITTASHTLFVLALFSLSVHAAPLTGVAGSSDSTLVMGGAVSGLNFLGGQEGFGPLDPTPLPAGLTADELIAKMGARESEFAKARTNYVFRQTVRCKRSPRTPTKSMASTSR